MDRAMLEFVSSIGITAVIIVIIFYLWLKKVIINDMIEPLIEPVKKEVKELREELNKKDDKLEKITETLQKNTETLNELKTIFNLIKGKIEISFKEK